MPPRKTKSLARTFLKCNNMFRHQHKQVLMSHRLASDEMVEAAMQVKKVKRKKPMEKMQLCPSFYLRQIIAF
jgi:hypothetical protein